MSAFGILWRAAVLYLGLAAALPTSTKSLGPHPKRARDVDVRAAGLAWVATRRHRSGRIRWKYEGDLRGAVILSLLYGSTLPADLSVRAVRLQIQ
jgi:hypothetical protein